MSCTGAFNMSQWALTSVQGFSIISLMDERKDILTRFKLLFQKECLVFCKLRNFISGLH